MSVTMVSMQSNSDLIIIHPRRDTWAGKGFVKQGPRLVSSGHFLFWGILMLEEGC
jgi:hypothetical protein